MSEGKTMPEWGEIVHVDGEAFVVIRYKGNFRYELSDKHGLIVELPVADFDEYR